MHSSSKWQQIKDAWASYLPTLEAGHRIDPYFIDWEFTPIEREAWDCIRRSGLPLYPQIPVAGFFLDFGDPHRKIGVELDGKAFHDKARDTLRDEKLWAHGWRIFRITGTEAVRWQHPPTEPDFAEGERRESSAYIDAIERFADQTGDGVLWSINVKFYHPDRYTYNEHWAAKCSLMAHRLVRFPLPEYEGA